MHSIDPKYTPVRRRVGSSYRQDVDLYEQVLNGSYLRNDCKRRLTNNFPIFPSNNAVERARDQAGRCSRSRDPAWSLQAGRRNLSGIWIGVGAYYYMCA